MKPVPKTDGWFYGPVTEWEKAKETAARLRAKPAAKGHLIFAGCRAGDKGHRIYVTPPLNVKKLAESFRVGEHAAMSYSVDAKKVVSGTAKRLESVYKICPFIVTFLDEAGLHAEFTRRLNENDAKRIEAVFSFDDAIQEGLDSYISDWMGEGPLMVPRLLEDQALQLWWD